MWRRPARAVTDQVTAVIHTAMKPLDFLSGLGVRPERRRPRRPPPGSSPGTLAGEEDARPPRITAIVYGPEAVEEVEVAGVAELAGLRGRQRVLWVNVDGVGHAPTVREIGALFGLHRLAMEDVVHVPQRPKVEDYGDYLLIVARSPSLTTQVESEQISLVVGGDFLLTFQERAGDPLEPVRTRIREGVGRIRRAGPDYLAYAVLDAVVDHYYPVLETFGERLDELEAAILEADRPSRMGALHALKRELVVLRRALWPKREALNALVRDPHPLVEAETRIYLRDTYDQVIQAIELVESYREMGASLTDLHLSIVGQKTNEIMRVLTVFAAIFIPLTFFAGVYGMNFDPEVSPWNMPELGWRYGYPAALGAMALIAGSMLWFFGRRGWLGTRQDARPRRRGRVRG
jgi:magnesium transporter